MKKITLFLAILSVAVLVYGIVLIQETHKTFNVTTDTELMIESSNVSYNIEKTVVAEHTHTSNVSYQINNNDKN